MNALLVFGACSTIPTAPSPQSIPTAPTNAQTHASAMDCQRCHATHVSEWKDSRHAQSWSNDIFQAAYQVASYRKWCADCHRPLQKYTDNEQLMNEGVSCTICHLEEGKIITSNPKSDTLQAPHSLQYKSSFGESEFCAQCHQFDLPTYHPMYSDVPAQNTYQEWVQSGVQASCQDCHMNNGHTFPGSHSLPLLQKSIGVSVEKKEATIDVKVRTQGIGHAFPTGDGFRRLQWDLCADEHCAQILHRKSFMVIHRGPSWHVEKNTAIAPHEVKSFTLERNEKTLFWQLRYWYGDPSLEKELSPDDVFILIHKGTI